MAQNGERAQPMEVVQGDANQGSVDFGLPELDGKVKRSVQDGVEVVGTDGVLPKILSLDGDLGTELLREPDVVLIAVGRRQRVDCSCTKRTTRQTTPTGGTREDQILVVRSEKHSRIGKLQHSSGVLKLVSNAGPGLNSCSMAQTGVVIVANTQIHRELRRDPYAVLYVRASFVDGGLTAKAKEASPARQVVLRECGLITRILRVAGRDTLSQRFEGSIGHRRSVGIDAGGIETEIGKAGGEGLR